MSSSKAPAIGIDLGTSYSSVGVFANGKVTIIADDQGNRRTPSCVAFTDTERAIGDAAKNLQTTNPANTIYDALRLIGRKFEDPLVQGFMRDWPFQVISDDGGRPKVSVEVKGERKSFFPEEICSMLLAQMKTIAEKHLGRTVTDAVVTVPGYFNYSQRQTIRDAATIAGLKVLRIISAPVASAVTHCFDDGHVPKVDEKLSGSDTEEKNMLIFDLGGGTLDVSILTIDGYLVEVKSTAGNNQLGGSDFDQRLLTRFAERLQPKHGEEITSRKRAFLRLLNACERAKKTLSESTEASIELDALFEDGTDFRGFIDRFHFEAINYDLFYEAVKPVVKCLSDAKMEKSQIDDVLLVGESRRIPRIRQLLQQFFSGKELKTIPNSDEAVAYGAAVYAAYISRDGFDEIPYIILYDVIPISLGVETTGGLMTTVIPRNTTIIPTTLGRTLKISTENQPVLMIKLFEGERAMAKENNLLGTLEFPGIFPALSTVAEVEVEVRLRIEDVDGSILRVEATEKFTGYEHWIRATFQKGLFIVTDKGQMNINGSGSEGGKQSTSKKRKVSEEEPQRSGFGGSVRGEPTIEKEVDQPDSLNNVTQDAVAVNKQILQEEIATDFVIVSQSVFLRDMIQQGFGSEAVTNRMEMVDMSEKSVKAFLAFLYYRDTTEASRNFAMAFELLRAAHKYDVKRLKVAMKSMILTKGTSWFGVDDAVRLFVFASNLEKGEDLKMKAVQVLKENISNLKESDCYKELYQRDPESAMDLYTCSLSK